MAPLLLIVHRDLSFKNTFQLAAMTLQFDTDGLPPVLSPTWGNLTISKIMCSLNVHHSFVEETRVRDCTMRVFVGQEREWNPDEFTEEDHKKRQQAEEGTKSTLICKDAGSFSDSPLVSAGVRQRLHILPFRKAVAENFPLKHVHLLRF